MGNNILKDWRKALVLPHSTILDVLKIIDSSALQIALVVDQNNRLLGTVTDGDVRRGLLRGIGLDSPVDKVMNKNPITCCLADPKDKIRDLMRQKEIHQIPLVDDNRGVIGIQFIEDVMTAQLSNWVLLMAGGRGARLKPLTNDCPKPMLKVGGKPILENILENCINYGLKNFFISVNYMAEIIKDYFGDGSRWGVNIQYLNESQKMGTGGAIGLLPSKPECPFFVMNSDLLTNVNLSQLLQFHKCNSPTMATMCVRKYTMEVPYGVIGLNDHMITRLDEKPTHSLFINAGIYILEPEVVDFVNVDCSLDMPDLFSRLIKKDKQVTAFPIHEYWMDIGHPDDFHRANGEFLEVFQK